MRGLNAFKKFLQFLQKFLNVSDLKSDSKQKSYAQNSDFVPFAKFGFVTVWQRKFEYFLPIIGFQKGQSNFLHDFIQVKANQKHITWKI